MESTIPLSTPPGIETNNHEHGSFNAGIMQRSFPHVSYVGSSFGFEGVPHSLPQSSPSVQSFAPEGALQNLPSQMAPTYAPLASPSWPAPCDFSHSSELQDLRFWTIDKVSEWLVSVGFGHLKEVFVEHRISGDVLLDLSQSDLVEMGVQALGDRKRILRGIALLRLPSLASNPSSPQGSVFP